MCQNLHDLRTAQTCRSAAYLKLATGLMRAMSVALNYPNGTRQWHLTKPKITRRGSELSKWQPVKRLNMKPYLGG